MATPGVAAVRLPPPTAGRAGRDRPPKRDRRRRPNDLTVPRKRFRLSHSGHALSRPTDNTVAVHADEAAAARILCALGDDHAGLARIRRPRYCTLASHPEPVRALYLMRGRLAAAAAPPTRTPFPETVRPIGTLNGHPLVHWRSTYTHGLVGHALACTECRHVVFLPPCTVPLDTSARASQIASHAATFGASMRAYARRLFDLPCALVRTLHVHSDVSPLPNDEMRARQWWIPLDVGYGAALVVGGKPVPLPLSHWCGFVAIPGPTAGRRGERALGTYARWHRSLVAAGSDEKDFAPFVADSRPALKR